ncbi:MAG TPA: hypothetical protein VFD35_10180, partial [Pricia sp.]|nr:hypothetical protein [Pricia sp.]
AIQCPMKGTRVIGAVARDNRIRYFWTVPRGQRTLFFRPDRWIFRNRARTCKGREICSLRGKDVFEAKRPCRKTGLCGGIRYKSGTVR